MPECALLDKPLLTEKETAFQLSVSVRTLQKWRYEGRGPRALRVEGCVRYSRVDLELFLASSGTAGKQ